MGRPFVAGQEPVPIGPTERQSPKPRRTSGSSPEFCNSQENGSVVNSATAAKRPQEDALLAAEAYFQEVKRSYSRKSSASSRSQRTLLDLLADETRKPAGLAATVLRRKSVTEDVVIPRENNSERPAEVKRSSIFSPHQAHHTGRESPSLSSLDRPDSGRNQSVFSPSVKLERTVSPPTQASNMDVGSSPSYGGQVTREGVHGRKSGNFAGADRSPFSKRGGVFQNRVESSPQGGRNSPQSTLDFVGCEMDGAEQPHHLRYEASDAAFEWNEVFRRSAARSAARSPGSLSDESFKTSKSTLSSTSSRGSLSDEAISERAAAWGNGVAKLVLKNSSRESTPRSSEASLADGLHSGQKIPRVSRHVKEALSSFQLAFIMCDVVDPEHPISFASAGFFQMTGYSAKEVIGRNCRFLQGVDTDAKELARIRLALKKGEPFSGTLLNYKKNGTPFWNLLTLSPIHDDKGRLIKYMGMQAELNHPATASRRKKTTEEVPRSVCESIAESAPSKRSERGDDAPVFTLPASRFAGTPDGNGSAQGSKRYSLTYGVRGSKRFSLTPGPAVTKRHSMSHHGARRSGEPSMAAAARPVGGSERYTVPTRKSSYPKPREQPSKNSFASRPLYWLISAARILEDEVARLGCDPNIAKECDKKVKRYEERRVDRIKSKNKVNRVASGVLGLIRKLERKVFKRETSRARGQSNRVNAYDFESDMEIDEFKDDFEDDLPEVGTRKNPRKSHHKSELPGLRSESMPHFSPTRGVSISKSALSPADLRVRSSRMLSPAMSDRLEKRISASYTNGFVPDRQQFCIVHE